MKLFIPIGSFYPDTSGGPSLSLYWLAKALTKHGVSITVLTTDRGITPDIQPNKWQDTDFGRVQYVRTLKNDLPFTLLLKAIGQIRKQDTIYLTSFFYPLSFLLAWYIVWFTSKKIIWGPRGEASPQALQFSSKRKQVVLALIRRLKHRIVFHATSAAEVEDIKQLLGDCEVVYIPNGVELSEPVTSTAHTNLLFLGRIHPIKGIDRLVSALSLSKHFSTSSHKLLIAGYAQQGYDQVLKQQIKDLNLEAKVEFIGKVNSPKKEQVLASSYCLILPSLSENFGVVIAEALIQGTPCIASKGTPWEELENYQAGMHVSNDPQSLAQAIDSLLEQPPVLYNDMRQNAHRLAEQVLDIQNYIPDWHKLLRKSYDLLHSL